ncbi:kinase-like protein [Trametopsis cervina]|nr:kinase-like protein [Trametopsis cervina]
MPESFAHKPEFIKRKIRAFGATHENLLPSEQFWKGKESLLLHNGYQLRPRYREGWKPSWTLKENLDMEPQGFEDFHRRKTPATLMDATEVASGRTVCIKLVRSDRQEHNILALFKKHAEDSRNHCVPLLETFGDPDNPDDIYMVMPYLRPIDKPPFETLGDVIDFVSQMLEGLTFMHSHNVAHRDCEVTNVMMDASALYPRGHHPVELDFDHTAQHPAEVHPRSSARVRYYYIDFGLSTYVEAPVHLSKYVLGVFGREQTVPELSLQRPYDAFKVDLYILGCLFQKVIYTKYKHTEWLCPLIEMMTKTEPEDRPTAQEIEDYWTQNLASYSLNPSTVLTERNPNPNWWELESVQETVVNRTIAVGRKLFGWFTELQG